MKNKKTILTLIISSAALLPLTACGGGGAGTSSSPATSSSPSSSPSSSVWPSVFTRADAVKALGIIDAKHSETSYSAKTHCLVSTTEKFVAIFPDSDPYTFQTTYRTNATVSSVAVTAKSSYGAYYDSNKKFGVYSNVGGALTVVKDDDEGTLLKIVNAKIADVLGLSTYASDFAKYLGNFNDDGSAISTGGTASKATFKNATFSSSAAGNLIIDMTLNYGYDEHIIYKWLYYDFVSKSKDDVATRYTWTSRSAITLDDSEATVDTNIENGKAILSLV